MPDCDHDHHEHLVFDAVDDPVVAYANSKRAATAERTSSWRAGVLPQQCDGSLYPPGNRPAPAATT